MRNPTYKRAVLVFSLACIQHNNSFFANGFAPSSITRYVPLPSIIGSSSSLSSSSTVVDNDVQEAIDLDALATLESCRTRSAANKVLDQALGLSSSPPEQSSDSNSRLWGSVKIPRNLSSRPISDAELSLQTRTINSKYKIYDLIEQNGDRDIDRASLAVLCVFVAGASSAIVAQQTTQIAILGAVIYIPEIVRFLVVWALCFSPLVLVGYGLALPSELSATLVSIQRQFFPSYRKRMIQHEAGHFLVGHLLGWPVKSYQANNAVKNAVEFYPLSDEDVGKDRARALGFDAKRSSQQEETNKEPAVIVEERPYFSKDGQGGSSLERSVFRDEDSADASKFALSPQDDPTAAWPFRGFDEETVDKLAVISVAGACAEILAYGNAEGGVADLVQLRRIYGAAASAMKSNDDGNDAEFGSFSDDAKQRRLRRENEGNGNGIDEKEMDNRTRFALGYAFGLLRQNLGALDALAETMEQDGSVADCIVALETCTNVSGYTLKGDYDKIRRERFQAEERGLGGWVEQTFLGGGKTIDVEDSSVIEGKGGGDRKQKFELTGDDPIYAALAVSLAFAAFAFNGGISLH
mmetsp:Transcript_3177/g.4885  ORF Transcript_3177/g.4885 Transcript_3177/m.4885 type:complete len:580 (+) Transcript_3177:118-1857(+)|eukprot:CAMPEP_0201725460 /NCGR_PEP_ID=MMETSP0593-20130828/8855_1 /ASSEMBLY_ACC=CAM_ASM_000672 /TAXON_ID=267983 /ORGANISM="Skeletonema japonicum, Strain CCMP2506" /LENGTH=579 /DNA_ID=CAMNT_0048216857 /DNA_START=23 /DNA_END=1762 /DNA_ORIENTATION=+